MANQQFVINMHAVINFIVFPFATTPYPNQLCSYVERLQESIKCLQMNFIAPSFFKGVHTKLFVS
jgi:hypothetical protein